MEKKYTVIDMFAGVGGLSKAFQNAGANIIYANDNDPVACKIFKCNFEDVIIENEFIQKIEISTIPDCDILVSGIPYPSYSIAGNKAKPIEYDESLFDEIVRIVENKKPRVVFLETVKGFLGKNHGKDLEIMFEKLREQGYLLKTALLDSIQYGNIPYSKERLYIVAFRDKECFELFDFPLKIELTNISKDLLNLL